MDVRYYSLVICLLITAVFFVIQGLFGVDLAWNVGSFEPNFFFSMIAHGSVGHLLGNLFALFLFGLILEGTVGSKRFLYVLAAAAVIGNLAGIGSYNRVLGISGGVYGLIGALTVLRPKMVMWVSGMPMPMVVAGLGYAFVDIVGAAAGTTGTGHFAHLAGFVVGGYLGWRWRDEAATRGEGFFESRSRRSRSLSREERRRLDDRLDDYEDRYLR